MAVVLPDLSVTITQRRWACVLDPTLALSHFGLPLVKRLGDVMEVWVVRELWHILDNTHFYLQQPETLLRTKATQERRQGRRNEPEEIVRALHEWERMRVNTEVPRHKFFWVGDGLAESYLPPDRDTDLVWRYESLSASLDRRIGSDVTLASAFRDAAALSAALDSALILTHLPDGSGEELPPAICQSLAQWGIPCRAVSSEAPLQPLESEYLRQLLAQSGLAKLLWAGLRPAALQLIVPAATVLVRLTPSDELVFSSEEGFEDMGQLPGPETDLWADAQGFWYPL